MRKKLTIRGTRMKLKQLLLISIAALSLGGSLYGMEADINGGTLERFFNLISSNDKDAILKLERMIQQHPTIVNAINPDSRINETALDYAIAWKPELVEILLSHGSNVNAPGKNYLNKAIRFKLLCTIDCKQKVIQLLCSYGATIGSDNAEPYKQDRHDALTVAEMSNNDEIVQIIQNHIHTRLLTAIKDGNIAEAQRITTKYNLNINKDCTINLPDITHSPLSDINPINPVTNPPLIDNTNDRPQPVPTGPTVITNNDFSWKWIGGGVAIVVACVAAKKLYNWWHTKAEVTKEKSEADAKNNESPEETIKDKTATQV